MDLKADNISQLRLINQQVQGGSFTRPKDLLSWMGALQAQDLPMATWAIGMRINAAGQHTVLASLSKGEIVRTHVLRPTWHFISADDASWMLDLSAPGIKRSLTARHRELEVTPAIVKKACAILEKALCGGRHLTREALVAKLGEGKIATHDQRAAHLFLLAELDKIICSGPSDGRKTTYALYADRIPPTKKISRDEALGMLALKYFTSHGPASLEDFTWWSGLPVGDARNAIQSVKDRLHPADIGSRTYWFRDLPHATEQAPAVYLFPAFDEIMISYKDRSACLSADHHRTTISGNGIFRPVVVINGKVTGTWKRRVVKKKAAVDMQFFPKEKAHKSRSIKKLLGEAAEKVTRFFEPGESLPTP